MSDITLTASSVAPTTSTVIARGTAFEQINAGQPIYADPANGNKLRVAGNTSGTTAAVVGIALNTSAPNQPLAYATGGDITTGAQLGTAATPFVLGSSAGNISAASDLETSSNTRYGTVLGISTSTTNLRLAIAVSGVINP
jgi:hypothetical protein